MGKRGKYYIPRAGKSLRKTLSNFILFVKLNAHLFYIICQAEY